MIDNLIILTVDRQVFNAENYIDQTIKNLEDNASKKYNIKIVVGSPDKDYLKNNIKYTIIHFPLNKWEYIKKNTVRQKATYNYYRAINLFGSNALIFEDDIIFCENWDIKLKNIIKDIESQGLKNYILSLYSPHIETTHFEKDYGFLQSFLFYGTQGMYYPISIKKSLTNWIYKGGVIDDIAPYDELISMYAAEHNIPIIDCKNSLVQHIAPNNSTGLCISPHTSPSFIL